jgi:hypothetical protein
LGQLALFVVAIPFFTVGVPASCLITQERSSQAKAAANVVTMRSLLVPRCMRTPLKIPSIGGVARSAGVGPSATSQPTPGPRGPLPSSGIFFLTSCRASAHPSSCEELKNGIGSRLENGNSLISSGPNAKHVRWGSGVDTLVCPECQNAPGMPSSAGLCFKSCLVNESVSPLEFYSVE